MSCLFLCFISGKVNGHGCDNRALCPASPLRNEAAEAGTLEAQVRAKEMEHFTGSESRVTRLLREHAERSALHAELQRGESRVSGGRQVMMVLYAQHTVL